MAFQQKYFCIFSTDLQANHRWNKLKLTETLSLIQYTVLIIFMRGLNKIPPKIRLHRLTCFYCQSWRGSCCNLTENFAHQNLNWFFCVPFDDFFFYITEHPAPDMGWCFSSSSWFIHQGSFGKNSILLAFFSQIESW